MRSTIALAFLAACSRDPSAIVAQEHDGTGGEPALIEPVRRMPDVAQAADPVARPQGAVAQGRQEAARATRSARANLEELRRMLERSAFEDRTPAQIAADEAVATDVRFDLTVEPTLSDCSFEAAAIDGVVLLRGRVPSQGKRAQAIAVAASARGVKRVIDRLVVAPPEAASAR